MTATGTGAAFLNLLDPGFRFDTAQVRAAAAANWYARTPTGIVVLRYRECAALMRDRRNVEHLAKWGVETGPFAQWMRGQLLDLEGEPHHRLRKLVSGAFQQRRIAALEPSMRAKTHELLERLIADAPAGTGRCEFMTAFADRFPAWVIADMLGIPDGEFDRFLGLATDLGLGFNPAAAQNLARVDAALTGLYGYCDELIARRRIEPVDDLVSAEADADRLSTEELRSLITGLVFAGQDTTRNQLGLALQLFSEHPEQWALLAARPELAASAVEEVMRYARPSRASGGGRPRNSPSTACASRRTPGWRCSSRWPTPIPRCSAMRVSTSPPFTPRSSPSARACTSASAPGRPATRCAWRCRSWRPGCATSPSTAQ
jgi:cytochrome P450